MSAISQKSISGITSITTPAGVDNVFTVHTNDTTERFRVDSNGNQSIAGILTVAQDLDVDGHTNLDNVSVAGVTTFTGHIEALSDVYIPDKIIHAGDANTQIRFPAADTFTVETAGSEKLRISGIGSVSIGSGANVQRKVDIVTGDDNGVLIRPTTGAEGSEGSADAIQDLIQLRTPWGSSAHNTGNAGSRFGIQMRAYNIAGGFEEKDPPKSAAIYAVSEDEHSGYWKNVGLALYTSGYNQNQAEKVRINTNGYVGIGTSDPTAKLEILARGDSQKGIRLLDSNTSQSAPYIEVIGKRGDGNSSQGFGGKIHLAKNRTDAKINNGNILGSVVFGGNHTDGTEANILYTASISAVASDSFDSATDMPTDLIFLTGSAGLTAIGAVNTSTGTEKLRITSGGQLELRKDQDGVTGRPTNRIIFKDTDTSVAANQPIGEISWYSSDAGMTNVNSWIRGINEHTNGNGALLFGVKAAGSSEIEALRITSAGRVIIGQSLSTNQPTYNTSTTFVTTHTNNPGAWNAIAIISGHTSGASFLKFGDKDSEAVAQIGHYNVDNSLRFYTNGSNERLRIDSSGDVQITNSLDILGNTDDVVQATMTRGADSNFQIQFRNESSSNNVNEPQGKFGLFYASNSADICGMQFRRGSSTGAGLLSFTTGGTERLRIDSSGRVMMGGATSAHGSANADDLVIGAVDQANQTGITIGSASASSIRFADAGNDTAGGIYYAHGNDDMIFYAGGNQRGKVYNDAGVTGIEHHRFIPFLIGYDVQNTTNITMSKGFGGMSQLPMNADGDKAYMSYVTHWRHRQYAGVYFWYGASGNTSGATFDWDFTVWNAGSGGGYSSTTHTFTIQSGTMSNGKMYRLNATSSWPSHAATKFVQFAIEYDELQNGSSLQLSGMELAEYTTP